MGNDFESKAVNSALWAAAGDALGWITELAQEGTVRARTGRDYIDRPVDWHRIIGGRSGVRVFLPAGTYSDDTQLRLAVSRAIRGNGAFDAEAFARIELTVWPSYALGAGRGTKAAAANLTKRDVNWFSNFFDKTSTYVNAGGNGAAMRVQPHVWAKAGVDHAGMLVSVLRDALITHGHPHGFAGAMLHALMLEHVLTQSKLPSIEAVHHYIEGFAEIPQLVERDRQLSAFWRSTWDNVVGMPLEKVLTKTIADAHQDLVLVEAELRTEDPERYKVALAKIGSLSDEFRGSGLKTALASYALASLYAADIETALIAGVNVVESDTDTIATLAGAMLGALHDITPEWPIQDREYITSEARRMAAIRDGKNSDSFAYPDLASWSPPQTQSDAVGIFDGGLALVGLGELEECGKSYVSGDATWQWMKLPFGQSILSKRRSKPSFEVSKQLLPGPRRTATSNQDRGGRPINSSSSAGGPINDRAREPRKYEMPARRELEGEQLPLFKNQFSLDEATERAIRSGFDSRLIGDIFNSIVDRTGSVELAVAFAGIVAKAKIARRRRS